MIDPNWINLLIQVPIVGAFIIYSIYMYRAFLEALNKHNEAFDKRNSAVIDAIADLNKSICGKLDIVTASSRKRAPARKKPA